MNTTYLNCAVGTLDVYTPNTEAPWNEERVKHLFRRIGFGANQSMIADALNKTPSLLIDQLLDEAISQPNWPKPAWGDWALSDYDPNNVNGQTTEQFYELVDHWSSQFLKDNALKAKLMMFWSNHFVTRLDDYQCPSYAYDYFRILEERSLGNFKSFVYDIGIAPSMLLFLNGVQNTNTEPNENYARELLELFTLGQDNNYTQADIVEAARALTGWNGFTEGCAPIGYVASLHDAGSKTIFGQTGNFGYDELIDLIFAERQAEMANYICTKLYTYYVNREANEDIVAELVQLFIGNNFEIAPVLRALFKSEHFFDEAHIGGKIKGPIESIYGFIKEIEYPIDLLQEPDVIYNQTYIDLLFLNGEMGQYLFNPVDVAGWQGDRDWINSTTLSSRWNLSDFVTFDLFENHRSRLILQVQALVGNSNDPEFIARKLIDLFIPTALQSEKDYENGVTAFKWEVPENYFQDGTWNLDWDQEIVAAQIAFLIRYISRLPEFQMA